MRKSTSGFTIVELLVVIAIIGILTTLSVISYFKIQASTRDYQRSSKVTVIAESLEKYFDQNGEYPSCAAMSAAAGTVASTTLKGLDPNVLATPTATSGTNSILPSCNNLSAGTDAIAYVGDGSATCAIQDCLQWTIKYLQESTGNIITISSRHKTNVATSGDITDLTVSAISFTQLNLSWTAVDNSTGYTIQRSTDNGFVGNLVSTPIVGNATTVVGLTSGTNYFFRVVPTFVSGSSNWSNTASATTLALSTPVATATINSTAQITLSWNAITYATSYTVNMSTSSSFTSPTVVNGIGGTSYAFTGLTPNTTYYFRVEALSSGFTSSWSNTVSAVDPHLATPDGTATTNSSYQITLSWGGITYATSYTVNMSTSSSFTSPTVVNGIGGTSYAFTSLSPATVYYFRVEAVSSNDTSSWSSTDTATTTIDAPAAPIISAYVSGGWAYGQAGAVACNGGTPYYQVAYNVNDGGTSWPGWTGSLVATGNNQGYKYGYWAYAYCHGPSADSAASGGNYAQVVIPINTPPSPCYQGPGSFWNKVYAIVNYDCASCPAGTSLTNTSFRSQDWYGGQWGPHPWGYNDEWDTLATDQYVYYWGHYTCSTAYTTSPYSPESYNAILAHHY